jgi:hypothetical protein
VSPFFFAHFQLRVLVEGYESSDAEKNFVAACNNLNLGRFDIAWKLTGLRAGRLQRHPCNRAPSAGFRTTNNE